MLLQRLIRKWRKDCNSDLLHCLKNYPLLDNILFVDVGARAEPIARWPKKIGKKIRFIGIDADPLAIEELKRTYCDYCGTIQADFFVVCLADTEKPMFFYNSEDGFQSTALTNSEQKAKAQIIHATTLDAFLTKNNLCHCFDQLQTTNILKIDVEGYSTQVLLGGKEFLSKFDIVLLESLPQQQKQYEAFLLLEQHEFVMVDLYRMFIPDDALGRRVALLDSVWVKRDIFASSGQTLTRSWLKKMYDVLVFEGLSVWSKSLPKKLKIGISDFDIGW